MSCCSVWLKTVASCALFSDLIHAVIKTFQHLEDQLLLAKSQNIFEKILRHHVNIIIEGNFMNFLIYKTKCQVKGRGGCFWKSLEI